MSPTRPWPTLPHSCPTLPQQHLWGFLVLRCVLFCKSTFKIMWARYAYLHIESATDTRKYETYWISWCTARCQLNCKYIACIAWETTMHVFVRHSPVSDIPPFYPNAGFEVSLMLALTNCSTNNWFASDLRCHDAHVISLQCTFGIHHPHSTIWQPSGIS